MALLGAIWKRFIYGSSSSTKQVKSEVLIAWSSRNRAKASLNVVSSVLNDVPPQQIWWDGTFLWGKRREEFHRHETSTHRFQRLWNRVKSALRHCSFIFVLFLDPLWLPMPVPLLAIANSLSLQPSLPISWLQQHLQVGHQSTMYDTTKMIILVLVTWWLF